MDFLSGLAKGDQPKPTSDQPDHQEKPSNSDLFASAKLVAGAAQAQFRHEPEKYDKAKVAGASADLLGAASGYAKLDETRGVGKYVDQAEDYLRRYSTSSQPTDAPVADPGDHKTEPTTTESTETEKPSAGGGDYIKMAEGFLSKPSGGGGEKTETSSGGGYGDLMKMAGDFLKK
jgi:hypothetical protein